MHPLGPRPQDWYGPDDWVEGDDVDYEIRKVAEKQDEWDRIYRSLPWWTRLRIYLGI